MHCLISSLYSVARIAVLSSLILLAAGIADALTITGDAIYSYKGYSSISNGVKQDQQDYGFTPVSFSMSVSIDGITPIYEYPDKMPMKYSLTGFSISASPFTDTLHPDLGLKNNWNTSVKSSWIVQVEKSSIKDKSVFSHTYSLINSSDTYCDFYNDDGSLRLRTSFFYEYDFGNFSVPAADISYLTLFDIANDFKWIATKGTKITKIPIYELGYSSKYFYAIGGTDSRGTEYDGIFIPKSVTSVPEPSTLLLVSSGLVGLGLLRKRFKP